MQRTQTELAEGTVLVEGDAGGFAQTVTAGRHRFAADEPAALGGGDGGPTPYDLLLAALGACTSMTLGMYARHKKWPLRRVAVRLRHERVHAKDCADCEAKEGQVDRIGRELELVGDLDETQRARLLEIAERCPVHRTLTGQIEVRTRLAE
jgi:putative redox protein